MLIPRADASTTAKGAALTNVPVVPDAPIGHFSFTLFGGKQGYLANTRSLCAHRPVSRGLLHRPERQDGESEAATQDALRQGRQEGQAP